MNFVILYQICVTNEKWYVRFVLIIGHSFCLRSSLVTRCDIWPIIGVISLMNATCGTGLYLSLYLVRILYFVVKWIRIILHQSKQTHSTTCQAFFVCKYQIPSSFPCCNLQYMNMSRQWSFLYSTIQCEMWLWNEGLSYDAQQFHQY